MLMEQLDTVEKRVGTWNPLNKFTNVYAAIDQLCGQIEEFSEQQAAAPQTPTGGVMARQTPSSKARDSVANKI